MCNEKKENDKTAIECIASELKKIAENTEDICCTLDEILEKMKKDVSQTKHHKNDFDFEVEEE